MIFRDPNTLYKINYPVGLLDSAEEKGECLVVCGHVQLEVMSYLNLDQIIILDLSNRYVTGVALERSGKWTAEIKRGDFGNDNSCLVPMAFATSALSSYIYPLQTSPAALAVYRNYVKSRLPDNSRDVPSIKEELRELVINATKVPYVARSIHEAITTGNNYQTIELDDVQRKGGRPVRERFIRQIDFAGKTVLDIGANTGENSRIARKLGASLVDGFEYDPYFVEIGRAINAVTGMTRVSLFQGDSTRRELFRDMKYDIVLALAVWVYIRGTMQQISDITNVLVFETHTLDHGIEFYYQPILKYFPHIISLGLTEKPQNPHQSRMFMVCGKEKHVIEKLLKRKFLKIKPYFDNNFIRQHHCLTKAEIIELAKQCYEKHVNRQTYDRDEYIYGTDTYFELFLAGFHQFMQNKEKIKNLVSADNLYLAFLKKGIDEKLVDQNLTVVSENSEWMIRKVSNKYEDALNILEGHIDRVPPVEIVPEASGKLIFTTTEGEELRCEIFDGHHRFFMCELIGAEIIHFVRSDDDATIQQRFKSSVAANYTLEIR